MNWFKKLFRSEPIEIEQESFIDRYKRAKKIIETDCPYEIDRLIGVEASLISNRKPRKNKSRF